jgi:predicted transcriptional regulator
MRILPSSAQIVAARALLQMEQRELAQLAKVHVSTLVRLEAAGWSVAPGNATTIDRVLSVLERKGVEFIELGVRLTKKPRRRDGA